MALDVSPGAVINRRLKIILRLRSCFSGCFPVDRRHRIPSGAGSPPGSSCGRRSSQDIKGSWWRVWSSSSRWANGWVSPFVNLIGWIFLLVNPIGWICYPWILLVVEGNNAESSEGPSLGWVSRKGVSSYHWIDLIGSITLCINIIGEIDRMPTSPFEVSPFV